MTPVGDTIHGGPTLADISTAQHVGLAKVRERIAVLERRHASYLVYQAGAIEDRDHHAAWDVAVNLSEVECELAGMRFVLKALGIEV